MCFGGGTQTVYAPPTPPPPKVPPRTDPASNIGQFQEEPLNAYGEPLGATRTEAKSDASTVRETARSTAIPYSMQQPLRF